MTGTAHSDQPASNIARNARRERARQHAYISTIEWFDTIFDDIRNLCDVTGVHGDDRAVVFHVRQEDDEQSEMWREKLHAVALVGLANEVNMTGDTGLVEWPDAVALWLDLLDCLKVLLRENPGPAVVLDLDRRTIATWFPLFCPDEGNHPDSLLTIPTAQEAAAELAAYDPFTELLTNDPDDESDDAYDNLVRLLTLHEIEPPTEPGHEPGEC